MGGASTSGQRTFLNVGCGPKGAGMPHAVFEGGGWRQVRVDLDPSVQPDVVASLTDLSAFTDASVDAVWSSHNLEHLYAHEVPRALREFHRVLRDDGFALMALPDVQAVAAEVAAGRLEEVLYDSPAGPISAIDVLWGHRGFIAAGNHFMAHRTGFTARTLERRLSAAGFHSGKVERRGLDLWAVAYKTEAGARRYPLRQP